MPYQNISHFQVIPFSGKLNVIAARSLSRRAVRISQPARTGRVLASLQHGEALAGPGEQRPLSVTGDPVFAVSRPSARS
ncbi:hypothetical protein AB0D30_30765 [Streptomyces sp. NPDC048409]|uniref:hypothetical protein n=1 Tax=Streptomyces sp. NPDC048409 TaxID=3154723 RepID=UPI00341B2F1B